MERRLAAIFSADVKGYSKLMGLDEEYTVRAITERRRLIARLVEEHGGRVVDSPGDNILAEFPSIVDAVKCAVEVQEELARINSGLETQRRMEFRIGINLGDVIVEGQRIYGDGVNLAARLEALAPVGGLCISGAAFEQVEDKLDLPFTYQGQRQVKNIAKPVKVYQLDLREKDTAPAPSPVPAPSPGPPPQAGPSRRRWLLGALLLLVVLSAELGWWWWQQGGDPVVPEEKHVSLAILPFRPLGAAPRFIGQGIAENLIAALATVPGLTVVDGSLLAAQSGQGVDTQALAGKFKVRYLLQGSVQQFEDKKLRVTARLLDAEDGHQLWARQFQGQRRHLLRFMDQMCRELVQELQVKFSRGGQARYLAQTKSLAAWEAVMRALPLFGRFDAQSNAAARRLLLQAVKQDHTYHLAWTFLAWSHFVDASFGFSENPRHSLAQARKLGRKVLKAAPRLPAVHSLWCAIHLQARDYQKSLAEGRRAVALGPSDALSHIVLAQVLRFTGQFSQALAQAQRGVRLSPYCPPWYLDVLGSCYRMAGRLKEALRVFKELQARSRRGQFNRLWPHLHLADVYMALGDKKKAAGQVAQALQLDPELTLERIGRALPYQNPKDLAVRLESLARAGMPRESAT